MDDFVVIFRNDTGNLDWGRVSAGSLSEAREYGRRFGAVKLLFPLSDLKDILHGRDPQSGRVDADVFNFVHEVSSSIKPVVIRISSSANSGHISKAVDTVKRFLDNVGAWYKHHKSKKSGSEYFLVERPDDRLSPEVDVRVSDHNLPYVYDQPDLDVDPDSPARFGSYSVPEALDLLEGFFDGDYVNIVDGEPVVSGKSYTPLYSGQSRCILSSVVPKVNVGNPVVQKMVDEVSIVLRGVNDALFSKIEFVAYEERRGEVGLAFVATSSFRKVFRVGVICGRSYPNGYISQLIANGGEFKTKSFKLLEKDDLRLWVEEVGKELAVACKGVRKC